MLNNVPTNTSNDAAQSQPRILFIVMPFASAHCGSIGVSTLKAILNRSRIASDIRYFNMSFAKQIGVAAYNVFSQLAGGGYRAEIFFSPHYFDIQLEKFLQCEMGEYASNLFPYLEDIEEFRRYANEEVLRDVCADIVQKDVPMFLSDCLESTDWEAYDIVGFSLMFDQTLPSLCLARMIKRRNPQISIMFGGAACDGEVAAEIIRSFDCVDVVVRGEADERIVGLVQVLRSGAQLDACRGIVFRRGEEIIETEAAGSVHDLDALPNPDYQDYMAQAAGLSSFKPEFGTFAPSLYYESSRGCWWGQKHLCSFCGLNNTGLVFRRKSPERVLSELLTQEHEYGISSFISTDNIIDMSYFASLLPKVTAINRERPESRRLTLFYETKSNLKKEQLMLLKEAGVMAIQPGIESFSDHILELMKKGSRGIQQVQFIKWATELGFRLTYGVLYGNPGERQIDYEEMTETVRFIRHLAPPIYITPMLLDRFSPYFNNPAAYGIRNVRAHESYRRIFPADHINHDRLAYRFSYDHDNHEDLGLQQAIKRCCEELKKWQIEYRPETLVYSKENGLIQVLDRRRPEGVIGTLRGDQAAIFEFCDQYHSLQTIFSRFPHLEHSKICRFLDRLVEREWAYRDRKDHFISLPIRRSPTVNQVTKHA